MERGEGRLEGKRRGKVERKRGEGNRREKEERERG